MLTAYQLTYVMRVLLRKRVHHAGVVQNQVRS
jgi:hypothetical protein